MARCFINGIGTVFPSNVVVDMDRQSLVSGKPDYVELIRDGDTFLRMGHAARMGVAAGLKCVGQTRPEDIDGIITATGLGMTSDTERFLVSVVSPDGMHRDPGPFLRSDANTIGMQLARYLGVGGYNVTHCHRGLSFERALGDAMLRMEEGARNVLVGAYEEMSDLLFDVQRRLGLYRDARAFEGAVFILLGCEPTSTTSCELVGVDGFSGTFTEEELQVRTETFLNRFGLNIEETELGDELSFKKKYGDGTVHSALMTVLAALDIQMRHAGRALVRSSFADRDYGMVLLSQC